MTGRVVSGPRCAAIVGTYLSGKTSLLECMLSRAGAITRRGRVREGNTVGDSAPEARAHAMSVEMNLASCQYLDEPWTFIDCPGNVELFQETLAALSVCDAAILVVEPGTEKIIAATRLIKELDERAMPYIVFVNKIDAAEASVRQTLEALQHLTARTMVLRELPIREGESVVGYVDLVSERAYKYHEGQASDLIEIPAKVRDEEGSERSHMLESLADFDDALMEKLLEDRVPATDEIYASLTKDYQDGQVVPVFFGSAEQDRGTWRLLKALRHDAPQIARHHE